MYGCVWAYGGDGEFCSDSACVTTPMMAAPYCVLYICTGEIDWPCTHAAYRSNVAEASEGWGAVDETEGC